jgi:16S rRNA (guanine966-N2)-methyltransferase
MHQGARRARRALRAHLDVVEDARVVDLFAGSGALGIEALSRGAAHAHFVESAAAARALIEDNLADLGFSGRATVLGGDATAAVADLPAGIDLVFADPPYAFGAWPELLDGRLAVVGPDAVAVLESDRSLEVGQTWEKMRERTYGGTVITFVTPSPPDATDRS